jgi:glycosyltransferase involved in cell wall biosynthesis
MACGKPSIVSDLPGVRTLIHEGETGVTVIPGDSGSLTAACRRFSQNTELVNQLGLRARTLASERYAQPRVDSRLIAELTRAAQSNSEY